VRLLWSQTALAPLRGLSLARERGWVLHWDADSNISLLNLAGERQATRQFRGLVAAAAAEDGGSYAAIGANGEIWLLAPDLTTRWERRLPQRAVSVAMDSFGWLIAVGDASGAVHLLNSEGKSQWKADNPRPLQMLTFVPEKPMLLGCTDIGLVACFDHTGHCVWRDGLVANVGSLASDGAGNTITLACFLDGLCCYSITGPPPRRVPQAAPCRLASLSYDGETILTADLGGKIRLFESDGSPRDEFALPGPAVAVGLSPLADLAFAALADGTLLAVEIVDLLKGK
jgi:hypothetical protein